MNKLSSVSGLIRQTLQDFQREAKIVLAVGSLAALPALLMSIIMPQPGALTMTWIFTALGFSLLYIFWSSLVSAGMYAKIAHPEEIHTMDEAMQAGMKRWFTYWTTAMLQWVYIALPVIAVFLALAVVIAGFVIHRGSAHVTIQYIFDHFSELWIVTMIAMTLFAVAGIIASYYSLKFIFSGFIVFKENIGNMAALRRSGELARGRIWDIAIKMFVFGLVIALISIALGIVDGIATAPILHTRMASIIDELFRWVQWMISLPLGFLFIANLYHDIIRANASASV